MSTEPLNVGATTVSMTTADLAAVEAVAPLDAFTGDCYADMRAGSGVTPAAG